MAVIHRVYVMVVNLSDRVKKGWDEERSFDIELGGWNSARIAATSCYVFKLRRSINERGKLIAMVVELEVWDE
jgi:hypothetical protein